MSDFIGYLYAIFVHLGGFGLLILGVLDSSFLFMPLGNDLLMVALTARQQDRMLFYAAMAAAGSVGGTFLIDLVSRKGGEKGLEQRLPKKRFNYVKKKVEKRAGWALALAALMPPPFPFTPVVAAAAAFQYPRKNLLAVIAGARLVRFAAEGLLAIFFGRSILKLAESTAVQVVVLAIFALAVTGSVLSILRWARRSKKVVTAGV